jgi:hypothetical protein
MTGTKKIASEWCSCMSDKKDDTIMLATRNCDSLAELKLEMMVKDKWKEVQEKQLSIDTLREYKLSVHMEYYKMTEKCRKSHD